MKTPGQRNFPLYEKTLDLVIQDWEGQPSHVTKARLKKGITNLRLLLRLALNSINKRVSKN